VNTLLLFLLSLLSDLGWPTAARPFPVIERPATAAAQAQQGAPAPMPESPTAPLGRTRVVADSDISNGF
jgi:hypothetical protein